MKNYGELQRLKGVGRATAKVLAAAGFTNLAKVAGAEPDELAEGFSTVHAPVPSRGRRGRSSERTHGGEPASPDGSAPGRGVPAARSGFSLVEVVIAMLILSVGLLGMAATTTTLVHQTNISGLKTHRALAMQEGIEQVRALPYDSISSGSDSSGVFELSWSTTAESDLAKTVQIVTMGPGLVAREGAPPVLQANVSDTFSYRVLRP